MFLLYSNNLAVLITENLRFATCSHDRSPCISQLGSADFKAVNETAAVIGAADSAPDVT